MDTALFPCSTCHEHKPLNAFVQAKHPRLLQGFPQQCKACKRVTYLAWYAEHSAEVIARSHQWEADHPERVKQRNHDYYLKHQDSWNANRTPEQANASNRARLAIPANKLRKAQQDKAYVTRNAEKIRARQRAYTATHSETIKARVKAWNKAHPEERRNQDLLRKARQLGAHRVTLSHAQWREIKEAFDHRCAYCGRKMQRLTRDHITPTVAKGDHHIHNIVPACQSCNSRKGIGPPLKPVQPLLLTLAPEHKKKKVS